MLAFVRFVIFVVLAACGTGENNGSNENDGDVQVLPQADVQQCGNKVELSWATPTQNEDGSPLTDLIGFKIYYGTVAGVYDGSYQVDNTGQNTYVAAQPRGQIYYYAVSAINSDQTQSELSPEISILLLPSEKCEAN